MGLELKTLQAFLDHSFDQVIDVRSPAEFAEDHVPGAINLPVLDDAERAEVGTIYKQQSPFKARKLGAALVFRNAAAHIEETLSVHEGGWRPLVYCWRGGQRSGSFTWMLREIGWPAETVQGGYRSYRRLVTHYLYEAALPFKLVQLGGYTGTAKTEVLLRAQQLGVQVLDLEDLAQHRGSLLGARAGGQPSQKMFETRLVQALAHLSPDKPVLVEAESSKIGVLNLPPALWGAMKAAPWIELSATVQARSRYLSQAYSDVLADRVALKERLQPLRFHRGHDLVDRWEALIQAGEKQALCQSLATDHYDPAYDKCMKAFAPQVLSKIELAELSDTEMDIAAERVVQVLSEIEM